jgi:hypothetical protein
MKSEDQHETPKQEYLYFVDGDKFESDERTLTGAVIKSRLPEAKRGYALWEEGHGGAADRLINDDTTVSLEKEKGPKRFFTVPPATFGRE